MADLGTQSSCHSLDDVCISRPILLCPRSIFPLTCASHQQTLPYLYPPLVNEFEAPLLRVEFLYYCHRNLVLASRLEIDFISCVNTYS